MCIISCGKDQVAAVKQALAKYPDEVRFLDLRDRLHCPTDRGYARVQHKAQLRKSIIANFGNFLGKSKTANFRNCFRKLKIVNFRLFLVVMGVCLSFLHLILNLLGVLWW